QFADALGGNAAGGEVGDAAGGEFQTHIRNIHFARQNRQADGADFLDRRFGEGEDDVEIVDHQIEHDVDIERARSEHAQPVHFEKHGLGQQREGGAYGGIEALEMPGLGDPAARGGQLNQFVGLGERGGQRFFDQHVYAGNDQVARNGEMMHGRNRDQSGLHLDVGGEQLLHRAESLAAELPGYGVRPVHVGIDDSQKVNGFALLFQLFVNAGV